MALGIDGEVGGHRLALRIALEICSRVEMRGTLRNGVVDSPGDIPCLMDGADGDGTIEGRLVGCRCTAWANCGLALCGPRFQNEYFKSDPSCEKDLPFLKLFVLGGSTDQPWAAMRV